MCKMVKNETGRITPAPAGRSDLGVRDARIFEDHPRACGEKVINMPFTQPRQGSPPRLRGEEHRGVAAALDVGITPAPAGRSNLKVCNLLFHGDHPRACGEKLTTTSPNRRCLGSPPRLRGEAYPVYHLPLLARITPAPAGRSNTPLISKCPFWDHPRACGEKRYGFKESQKKQGSPPRLRGEARNVAPE